MEPAKIRHRITGLRRLSITPDLKHIFLTIDCEDQSFDFVMPQEAMRVLAAELSSLATRIDAGAEAEENAGTEEGIH